MVRARVGDVSEKLNRHASRYDESEVSRSWCRESALDWGYGCLWGTGGTRAVLHGEVQTLDAGLAHGRRALLGGERVQRIDGLGYGGDWWVVCCGLRELAWRYLCGDVLRGRLRLCQHGYRVGDLAGSLET